MIGDYILCDKAIIHRSYINALIMNQTSFEHFIVFVNSPYYNIHENNCSACMYMKTALAQHNTNTIISYLKSEI